MKDDSQAILNKIFGCLIAIIVLLSCCFVTLLVYLNNNSNKTNNNTNENKTTSNSSNSFTEMTTDEIASKSSDKTIVIYLGRDSCSWCIQFAPHLEDIQDEYDEEIYYIDMGKIIDYSAGSIIDNDAYSTLLDIDASSSYSDFMSKNLGSTPILLIIKDGKLIGGNVGYIDYDKLVEFLEDSSII